MPTDDTESASTATPVQTDATTLVIAQIPNRNDTAKYKIWRFKTLTKCHAIMVKGQTIDKVIAWCGEINDSAISLKDLYDKRTSAYANIDAQLFSALVNATGGGAWGD